MAELASFIVHINDDGTITTSGYTASDDHERAVNVVNTVMPGSEVVADPWTPQADQGPWPGGAQPAAQPSALQQYYQPTQQAAPPGPTCQHGPLKIVPGGFSQAKGKAYAAFWACPAAQGQQCRLNKNALPPIPNG